MAAQSFNCPNCGAPLDYDGSGATTVRCPYCSTSVMVPLELRPVWNPVQEESEPRISVSFEPTIRQEVTGFPRWAMVVIGLVAVFSITVIGLPFLLVSQATNSALSGAESMKAALLTETAQPSRTPTPTITPTPQIGQAVLNFGGKGIGPGLFDDARYIAVDGQGMVYVADYEGGRVQVFDATGKYSHQWKVGGKDTILYGLAANRKGEVFAAFDGSITRFDGASGQQQAVMTNPKGGEYGDVTVTADGGLAAVWYEGRWGMITELKGHSDDLVLINAQGKAVKTISAFISGQTDNLALDTLVAVDGAGTIYALSYGEVFKFSPEGKFINRFGSSGDQPDQFSSPTSIAVDGQGRLYVGGSRKVWVFTPEGRYLDSFDTDASVDMLAIDAQGALWAVSRERVTKYVVTFR